MYVLIIGPTWVIGRIPSAMYYNISVVYMYVGNIGHASIGN